MLLLLHIAKLLRFVRVSQHLPNSANFAKIEESDNGERIVTNAFDVFIRKNEAVAMDDGSGGLLIGRQALRDALSATADFEGLTGILTCNETGDCATGEALGIFQITDAEISDDNWPPAVIWTP